MSTAHHQKGRTVKPMENNAKPSSPPRTGLFALLWSLLHVQGSGMPKADRGIGALSAFRRFAPATFTTLCALAGGLLFCVAPALASREYSVGPTFGAPGSGAGQLESPGGDAVNDATGDVYVADTGNHRVDEFTATGEFAMAFGKEVGPLGEADCTTLSTCKVGTAGAEAGELDNANGVAVDNSTGSSKEDVYVSDPGNDRVDKFSAAGAYLGELTGRCAKTGETPPACAGFAVFHDVLDVAVGPAGEVWVEELEAEGQIALDEFSSSAQFEQTFNTGRRLEEAPPALAVDSAGELYVNTRPPGGHRGVIEKFDSATDMPVAGTEGEAFGKEASAVAVDPVTSEVLVDHGYEYEGSITLFGAFGEPYGESRQTFDETRNNHSYGIAVNGPSGTAYVTRVAGDVEILPAISYPTAVTDSASSVSSTAAALRGSVNPTGEKLTECAFEYTTESAYREAAFSGASTVSCEQGLGNGHGEVGEGFAPVPVSAKVAGLQPRTAYRFRLHTANAHGTGSSGNGAGERLYTIGGPAIAEESVSNVGPTFATIGARVNPAGLPSSYRVEYATSDEEACFATASCPATPEVSAGAAQEAIGVQIRLSGLQPETAYRARVVAENALGASSGPGVAFTSARAGVSSSQLPDGRVYEDVSLPAHTGAEVYHPITGLEPKHTHQTFTLDPVRAGADGNSVAYTAEAPPTGGSGSKAEGKGDVFLATRGAGGWDPIDITPPIEAGSEAYDGFSADLSLAFLSEYELSLASEAPSPPCDVLYARSTSDSTYHPLFSSTETPGHCGTPRFAGVSADNSSMIFESEARLTPEAIEGRVAGEESTYNLYDSVNGRPYLVNVLPDRTPDVNAAFGGVTLGERQSIPGYHHYGGAINSNGSSIVWTDLNTGNLYVREDPASPDASTVPIAEGGYFRGASSDGSKVLFTDEHRLTSDSTAEPGMPDLYECELPGFGQPCRMTDLTPDSAEPADVQGVLGNSEDGSYVYFVADGALAPGAVPQLCRAETEGEKKGQEQKTPNLGCNLYLWHSGEPRFIATLAATDNTMASSSEIFEVFGDWRTGLATRTAEVTPDGRTVAFVSHLPLTGYQTTNDCREVGGDKSNSGELQPCLEVFTYDVNTGRVSCVSCNPTGAPPDLYGQNLYGQISGRAFMPTPTGAIGETQEASYQLRTVSEDGGRVFFDSPQPLVSQAKSGVEGVYEWEREGEGSCTAQESSPVNGGCVFLLSSGLSDEEAVFLDADATGDNVFFTTRAQLVPEDHNELVDLYDARVGGGFPHLATACTGTGCQGAPPASPAFATPSSVTFNGVGNFPPPSPPAKKVVKKAVKCSNGKHRNSKGRCVKNKKSRKAKKTKRAGSGRRVGR